MKKTNTSVLQGMSYLMLAQIMVGINIVSSKFLLSSFSTVFLLAMRFGLATLILFSLHLLDSSNKKSVLCKFNYLFLNGMATKIHNITF